MEQSPDTSPVRAAVRAATRLRVTVFACTNCVHRVGGGGARTRHSLAPVFPKGCEVQEIVVPCTGRLQPEHLLRVIEEGADLVCIVACAEDNCHFLEGSKRVRRRAEYVQHLLEEIGAGKERVLLLHLPGSAREDMAAKAGKAPDEVPLDGWSRHILAASSEVAERLRRAPFSVLHGQPAPDEYTYMPLEESEENED